MPGWDEILLEVQNEAAKSGLSFKEALVQTRRKYINEFADYRDRNAIVYYSGWLSKRQITPPNLDINDSDMTGFMTTAKGLDQSKGLDLIIHTSGGSAQATEGIVTYLHSVFPDIQVFVPHMCMSAGTMLACSASHIWLGKHSCLGPIDPQFAGVSAYNIKKEFEAAKKEMGNSPKEFRYWQTILAKYPITTYYVVLDAIQISSQLAKEWLSKYMFSGVDPKRRKMLANRVVKRLNINTGSHSKHFDYEYCRNIGMSVTPLESDQKVQDLVLSIYHACRISSDDTYAVKIIENNLGKSYIFCGV